MGLTRKSRDGTSLYGPPARAERPRAWEDIQLIRAVIRETAEAAQNYDGEVELRVDFK
jgi:hypothetical protein